MSTRPTSIIGHQLIKCARWEVSSLPSRASSSRPLNSACFPASKVASQSPKSSTSGNVSMSGSVTARLIQSMTTSSRRRLPAAASLRARRDNSSGSSMIDFLAHWVAISQVPVPTELTGSVHRSAGDTTSGQSYQFVTLQGSSRSQDKRLNNFIRGATSRPTDRRSGAACCTLDPCHLTTLRCLPTQDQQSGRAVELPRATSTRSAARLPGIQESKNQPGIQESARHLI